MNSSRMRSILCSYLTIIFLFFAHELTAQDAVKALDQAYGLDQTLCNGKKYTYSPPAGTKGDQYLISLLFSPGSVTLRGKRYEQVNLNYDVLNQELLLQYADQNYPWNIIEVSKAWLTSFRIGKMDFEYMSPEQAPRFYQELGTGSLRILYSWRKELKLNDAVGSYNFMFTPALRDSYVLMDGQLKPFTNRRSLIRLFDPAKRAEIKSYVRKNKIKIKKAPDQVMTNLVDFIGTLR